MENDMKAARITVGMHTVAAIIAGYLSNTADFTTALGMGLIILIFLRIFTKRVIRKTEPKWWITHGLVMYLLVWFLAWVSFFNVAL